MKGLFLTLVVCSSLLGYLEGLAQTELEDPGEYVGNHPFDLTETIYKAGSDLASSTFQSSHLPELLDFVAENTAEWRTIPDDSAFSILSDKLVLSETSNVRAYFLSEGAGYHNTVGLTHTSALTGISQDSLVLANGSTLQHEFTSTSPPDESLRNSDTPLLPGDFVDLGTLGQGDELDFFLIADGARGGTDTFRANAATNPDLLPHVAAAALPGSPFLLLSFEDLYGGGDEDFNDLVLALNLGAENVNALLGNPEPGLIAMTLLACMFLFLLERSRQNSPTRSAAS